MGGRHASERGAKSRRATTEYALLGLVSRAASGEIHGYDLSREFNESVVSQIVRLESGMLYHYLKRLSRDGLLSTRVERQTGRPDRQVHAITPAGSQALREWISEPVRSTREIRLEFLLKLYLARQIDPAQATRLAIEQRDVMRARCERLAQQLASAQPDTPDNVFGETVLKLRWSQTQSALEWLEALPEAIE